MTEGSVLIAPRYFIGQTTEYLKKGKTEDANTQLRQVKQLVNQEVRVQKYLKPICRLGVDFL